MQCKTDNKADNGVNFLPVHSGKIEIQLYFWSRNHWTNFNIILQKCSFGDPLPRLFKPFGFIKNMVARGRGLFSLYICIENFKNLLVRNHWTDFNIILQKCSFGNPLPRLFKPFGFIKKHGRQGAGLIFPIYLYRNL